MLDAALQFLVAELNTYMLARIGTSFGSAEMGRLVDDSGKSAIKEDHLGVCVVNLQEEHVLKNQVPQGVTINGRQVLLEPELRLTLKVLFAANFRQYDQALRQLSWVMTFFQSHRSFDRDGYPGLDRRIERLVVDLESLGYEQLNQLWSFVGGKQLPSAVYCVRLVLLQDLEPTSIGPPITTISTTISER